MDFRDRNSNISWTQLPSVFCCCVCCFPSLRYDHHCRQRREAEVVLWKGHAHSRFETVRRPDVLLFSQKETHREMGKKRGTDDDRLSSGFDDDEMRMTMMIMNG